MTDSGALSPLNLPLSLSLRAGTNRVALEPLQLRAGEWVLLAPSHEVVGADVAMGIARALASLAEPESGRIELFGRALETLAAVDHLLAGLNENDRFERMVTVLDRAGPTLDKVDGLLTDLREPLVSLVGSPELRRAISGLDSVLNDPATRKTLQRAAEVLAPERLNRLLARTESVLASVDSLAGENGALNATLINANRLLSDGRADRLINAVERLTDEQKLGRIIDNTAVIAEQMARIGPDIPALTREMALTLREAVVVLKALQQTWILEGKAEKARRELERSGDAR